MSDDSLKSEYSIHQTGTMPISTKEATSLMIEKARQLVVRLVDYRGNDTPPFLPREYSRLVGIKDIQKTNLGYTSALLLKFHDGYVIKVNWEHHQVRQNFSCAHEIGHILFNDLKLENYLHNIEYRTFNPSKTMEIRARAREELCDAVAAELLMPESVFRKYLSSFGLSITSVKYLANTFKVSVQAAIRRIAEVSIEPCIAILWWPWPKNNPKGLRAVTVKQSMEKTNYVLIHKYADINSAFYKAYQKDNVVRTWKNFEYVDTVQRLPMEAIGFGRGETRLVISLAFPNRLGS